MESVVLVDDHDRPIGTAEKLAVHREGRLHRAFSVLIRNAAGDVLLQRRAPRKYHSAGRWANTCCGHPRPDEDVARAAERRLREEMGLTCALDPAFTFCYRADVGAELTEHEYDHVFVGRHDGPPTPNADEVDAWRWTGLATLRDDVNRAPAHYAVWFRMLLAELEGHPT